MSYLRASTAPKTGWRPGTLTLGTLDRTQDWKQAAAQENARRARSAHRRAVASRAAMNHLLKHDAFVRRDGQGMRRLSGFGALDLSAQMVKGARYLFHFTYGGLGIRPGMDAVTKAVTADTNFTTPVASVESNGVQVSFVYNGQGSTVGNAGAEMQNVINNFSTVGVLNSLLFSAAEGGPAPSTQPSGVTVFAVSPDGTIIQYSDGSFYDTTSGLTYNADGSVKSAAGTPPGTPPKNPQSFSWTNFFEGLGTGGAIAVGLGALLVLKEIL